jgi:hypothetical protein
MNKNRLAIVLSRGASVFSILGGIGILVLILYPNRINYIQQTHFNKISAVALLFLIIGIVCAWLSLCASCGSARHYVKGICQVSIPLIILAVAVSNPRLLFKSVLTAQNICINNERKIDAAKAEWAQRTGATNGAIVTWDKIAPYFANGFPKCPVGGTYNLGKIGDPVLCSIPSHNLPP